MREKPKKSFLSKIKSFLLAVVLIALAVESVALYRLYKLHIGKPELVNIDDREILPMEASIQEKLSRLQKSFKDTSSAAWAAAQNADSPEDAWFNLGYRPRADFREDEESFFVSVDVPGVDPAELSVALDGLALTLTGTRSRINKNSNVLLRERHRGEFTRTFEIPGTVSADGIKANLASGVLKVKIPKGDDADLNIAIKVESGVAVNPMTH